MTNRPSQGISETKRPESLADLLDFETAMDAVVVLDAQLSPDGGLVAYVTSGVSTDRMPNAVGMLWLVSAQGGQPRLLATPLTGNGAVRWSPDGKTIAFISDREQQGVAQLYLCPLETGEAVCVTDQPGGVISMEWAPNGAVIALSVAGGAAETAGDDPSRGPQVIDEGVPTTGLWLLAVSDLHSSSSAAMPRRLSPEDMHIDGREFSWAPDSGSLVATTAESRKAHDLVARKLVTISLRGDTRVIADIDSLPELGLRPRYSQDGSTIAFNGGQGSLLSMYTLVVVPASGGTARALAPDFFGSFCAFEWLPDSKRLLAVTQEKQSGRVVTVDIESGAVEDAAIAVDQQRAVDPFVLCSSLDGDVFAFVSTSDKTCGDVFVAELGGEARQLTDLNPWTRKFDFGDVLTLSWEASDGTEIEGLLTLPVGYQEGRRYPLLVEIHGGPAGCWSHRLWVQSFQWGSYLAQRGYAVLRPNPRGSSGRGAAFQSSIVGQYGGPDLDDIMRGTDKVVELGIADPERLVVGGASGGGYLVNQLIVNTSRFVAAISLCGISNWVSFQGTTDIRALFDIYFGPVAEDPTAHWNHSPIRSVGGATTPTLILFGECDQRVPTSQGFELYEGLKASGVEATLVIYPREGHAIIERGHQIDVLERVVSWLDDHVCPAET